MRRFVLCPSYPCDPSVASHNDNRRKLAFQSPIQEGEALDIQHVHFVDEEDTRYNIGFSFFSPICYLAVDLVTQFRLNLASIACEQCEETLCTRVDDVDFMQGDSVDDFFAYLQLAFRTLDKLGLFDSID
jgi:hypothetical protein